MAVFQVIAYTVITTETGTCERLCPYMITMETGTCERLWSVHDHYGDRYM